MNQERAQDGSGLWRESFGENVFGRCAAALWRRMVGLGRRPARRLRLCESLPLGDRRFVAVVEFDESRFLVGGTSTALVLLARLGRAGRGETPSRPCEKPAEELR